MCEYLAPCETAKYSDISQCSVTIHIKRRSGLDVANNRGIGSEKEVQGFLPGTLPL